jgi:hypothetical protein
MYVPQDGSILQLLVVVRGSVGTETEAMIRAPAKANMAGLVTPTTWQGPRADSGEAAQLRDHTYMQGCRAQPAVNGRCYCYCYGRLISDTIRMVV